MPRTAFLSLVAHWSPPDGRRRGRAGDGHHKVRLQRLQDRKGPICSSSYHRGHPPFTPSDCPPLGRLEASYDRTARLLPACEPRPRSNEKTVNGIRGETLRRRALGHAAQQADRECGTTRETGRSRLRMSLHGAPFPLYTRRTRGRHATIGRPTRSGVARALPGPGHQTRVAVVRFSLA